MNSNEKAEWMNVRRTYLGGTDIAKIVGASPYGGAYDVFLSKTGQDPFQGNAATRVGQYLEPAVAQMYADAMGRELGQTTHVMHPEFPFLGGNPDYLTDDPNLGLEIKTAAEDRLYAVDANGNRIWGDAGSDEVPLEYLVQCQWYMGLTGRQRWDLAAFFLGARREFRVYHLKFDAELYALLVQKGVDFWKDHMETGIAPDMDALPSELVRAHLMRRAQAGAKVVQATGTLETLALAYWEASEGRKKAEEREAEIKAQLMEAMAGQEAQKIQGQTDGAKWLVAIQGGGTDSRLNSGLVLKEYRRRLLALGVREEELEAIDGSHTQTIEKMPFIRGYFNSLKKTQEKAA